MVPCVKPHSFHTNTNMCSAGESIRCCLQHPSDCTLSGTGYLFRGELGNQKLRSETKDSTWINPVEQHVHMRSYGCVSKNGIGPLPQKKGKSKHLGVVSELAFPGEKKAPSQQAEPRTSRRVFESVSRRFPNSFPPFSLVAPWGKTPSGCWRMNLSRVKGPKKTPRARSNSIVQEEGLEEGEGEPLRIDPDRLEYLAHQTGTLRA